MPQTVSLHHLDHWGSIELAPFPQIYNTHQAVCTVPSTDTSLRSSKLMSMTALAVTFGILTGKGAVVSLISDVYVDIYIYYMYISYIYSI